MAVRLAAFDGTQGLWAVLPPSYYADRPDRRYLTFDPPRAGPDPMPCKPGEGHHKPGQLTRDCGGEDPAHGLPPKPMGKEIYWQEGLKRSVRLRANVALMARQVHALRDAMGIARVLNRTLVIPHFECLCDRSGAPPPRDLLLASPPRCSVRARAAQAWRVPSVRCEYTVDREVTRAAFDSRLAVTMAQLYPRVGWIVVWGCLWVWMVGGSAIGWGVGNRLGGRQSVLPGSQSTRTSCRAASIKAARVASSCPSSARPTLSPIPTSSS